MRVLVTGAGGMLGSAVVPALVAAGHHVFATDLRGSRPAGAASSIIDDGSPDDVCSLGRLDVRSIREIDTWFGAIQPELVLHLAAETDVDRCEAEPDHAYATNALGTKNVALACQRSQAPLAYVSTAGVFDGRKEDPYTEYDQPNPINVYGKSKLEGERCVQSFLHRFFIIRAGWMVGGGQRDHKFVAKILRQLLDGATTIYAVGDRLGTPTYAPDFARCLLPLLDSGSYGLYHLACLGRGTRFDVAQRILHTLGRADVRLIEVSSEFFHDSFPAPRPRSEMMRNLVLDLQGLNSMRPWTESLDEYLRTAFADLSAAPVGRR